MAHLHLKDTVLTERRLPLPGRVVVLGRSLDADVPIPHVSVSRRHALVELTRDGYVISDLGSSNGTYVGGRALPPGERAPVPLGESFTVGKVEIRIVPDEILGGEDAPIGAPAVSAGIEDLKTEAFPALGPILAPPRPPVSVAPEAGRTKGPDFKKRIVKRRAKRDAMRWAGIGITVVLLLAAGFLILSIASKKRNGEDLPGPEAGAPAGSGDGREEDHSREVRPLEIDENR